MRLAFEEILEGHEVNSNTRMSRGWKLLMLLPRMLLHRPSRGGRISRKQLEERFRRFQEGEWLSLLREGQGCCSEAHRRSVRRRRRNVDELEVRASRALHLCQLGELSSARQALEGATVAPGDLATLRALTDPDRRPALQRVPLSREVMECEPDQPFVLDPVEFLLCLRTARRGAAAGPSGMTSDHLFPIWRTSVILRCLGKWVHCWRQASSLQRCWKVCVWGG